MAVWLCDYSFEDEETGVERTWAVYGSYTPPRPPPRVSMRNYDATLCDPGDPEEIEIEYAEEGKLRVSDADLAAHEDAIKDRVREEPPYRRRGRFYSRRHEDDEDCDR